MGTAHIHGGLWGERAHDYAEIVEPQFRPVYEQVFDAIGVGAGARLLDVGCGPGLAASIAAQRGAQVAGLDAADASVAIAAARTAMGDFRIGEMEALPWPADSFDAVTSFNAFQFAASPLNALREARRVLRRTGRVALVVWGKAEECETVITMAAVGKLAPPTPGPNGAPLGDPERATDLLAQARLIPVASGEVDCTFAFANLETALRAFMSVGAAVAVARQVGDDVVRQTIAASLAPFRTRAGVYCQRNRFCYLVAEAT